MTAHPHPTPPQAAWARLRAALLPAAHAALPAVVLADAPARFAVRVLAYPGAVAVEVRGPLVDGTRQELRIKVLEALEAGARVFVLDLEGTGYADGRGLGALYSCLRAIVAWGGAAYVTGIGDDLRVLLDLRGLGHTGTYYASRGALGEAAA